MELVIPGSWDAEQNVVLACMRREKWAQQALYEEYYARMMGVCMRYANNENDALDIMHEGFIKILRNIHSFQPGTSLVSWIRRIMVNTAIDYYRSNMRRRTSDMDEANHIVSFDADAVSRFSEMEILEAVQMLTPAYRAVFNLYVIEGYSHKEISQLLDVNESTSRSNLVKARLKLQNILLKQR
jgi:RNA polymerase sigma-70 factor (ECF subfamily)